MKKFLSIVSFLVLFSFNTLAGTKVGEIVGQMGTTWNEREGKNETVIMGYELLMNDFLMNLLPAVYAVGFTLAYKFAIFGIESNNTGQMLPNARQNAIL